MSFFVRFSLAVLMSLVFASPCLADASTDTKMFSASGIRVDVTAENAAKAREKALLDGQKRALMIVMERLTPSFVLERLPELIPDDIVNMVQDMSVSSEKTSSVRYMATLEIRFNADSVRKILKDNGLPFVRTSGKPLLILPLYKKSASASPVLWEDDNAWLRAWINRPQNSYMVPLFVPMGELSDVRTLSAEQVVKGDLNAAKRLAARYEAQGILIVEMTRKGSVFSVQTKAMDDITASEIPAFGFTVSLKQNTAKTFASAVEKVVRHIEDIWKQEQMVQFNEIASLIAMLPVSDLKQWQLVQERLERIPSVSSFELQAARTGLLQLTIFYAESLERLQNEMRKRMLELSVLPSGVYKLQLHEEKNFFAVPDVENTLENSVITPRMQWEVVQPKETDATPVEPDAKALEQKNGTRESVPVRNEPKGGMIWKVGP